MTYTVQQIHLDHIRHSASFPLMFFFYVPHSFAEKSNNKTKHYRQGAQFEKLLTLKTSKLLAHK